MSVRYEIRQQVKTILRSWLEPVSHSTSHRCITVEYERLVAEYPSEYFEVVEISSGETCLAFTPKKGP